MFKQSPIVIQVLIILLLSISLSSIFNIILIKIQNKRKLFQPQREELSSIHKDKSSTPTLGGIGIYLSCSLSLLITNIDIFKNKKFILVFILISAFFVLGFIDDLLKVIKKDYHGAKDSVRFFIEVLLSLFFLRGLGYNFVDFQKVHFLSISLNLGVFSIILLSFILVGTSNAMNLSDGLDGLATCLFIVAIMPFAIYAFKNSQIHLGLLLVASFGSSIGFVIFNMHPSKIFMGDCGSLYLGSILASSAIVLHQELMLVIAGLLLIIETSSVIIQVIYYKITKKRIFLMAPFHHHLELKGYSEEKVVLIFIVIGYILSFVASLLII